MCPHCSTHLGWLFEPSLTATTDRSKPSKDGFYALIVDNVIGEKCMSATVEYYLFNLSNVFHSDFLF